MMGRANRVHRKLLFNIPISLSSALIVIDITDLQLFQSSTTFSASSFGFPFSTSSSNIYIYMHNISMWINHPIKP